nr:MAG TPA: MqsA [Caudoviricetes sp.]
MVCQGKTECPNCKGSLRYYDSVKRIIKGKYGKKHYVLLGRYRCCQCGIIHRSLPENILPYKHYEAEIIFGVLDEIITSDTLGFEDYPNEQTMREWQQARKKHSL